jgi:hypothetical protein
MRVANALHQSKQCACGFVAEFASWQVCGGVGGVHSVLTCLLCFDVPVMSSVELVTLSWWLMSLRAPFGGVCMRGRGYTWLSSASSDAPARSKHEAAKKLPKCNALCKGVLHISLQHYGSTLRVGAA